MDKNPIDNFPLLKKTIDVIFTTISLLFAMIIIAYSLRNPAATNTQVFLATLSIWWAYLALFATYLGIVAICRLITKGK